MSEDIKERLRKIRQSREVVDTSPAPPEDTAEEHEPDMANDSVSWTRASNAPEVSLRLTFQKGQRRALPYFMLQDLFFDPDSGLLVEFVHCRIEIRGRNLALLFDRLADHKVRHIQEMDELAAERFPEGETVVTRIAVVDP